MQRINMKNKRGPVLDIY